jgi:hypothetical protein
MVRTFLKVYMELGSYFLFLQEQIKEIIIPLLYVKVQARQRHHVHELVEMATP